MKTINFSMFLVLMFSIFMFSCEEKTRIENVDVDYSAYQISFRDVIPEKNKEKAALLMEKLVTGASHQMTAGDYEDPEDVIEQAEEAAMNLYGERITGLYYNYKFIPESEFTTEERRIYEYLSKRVE